MYDAGMNDAYTIHISMILDHEACISDAVLFGDERTNERTDKPILGVGLPHFTSTGQ